MLNKSFWMILFCFFSFNYINHIGHHFFSIINDNQVLIKWEKLFLFFSNHDTGKMKIKHKNETKINKEIDKKKS